MSTDFNEWIVGYIGLYCLGAVIAIVLCVVLTSIIVRYMKQNGQMSAIYGGGLRYAAASNNIAALEYALSQPDFDINSSHFGYTALHAAVVCNAVDAVHWLLRNGASTNVCKYDGWNDTALHYAASKGNQEICELLCAYGANVHARNFHDAQPIHLVSKRNELLRAYLSNVMDNKINLDRCRDEFKRQSVSIAAGDIRRNRSVITDRRYDGYGTPSTIPYKYLTLTRFIVVLCIGIAGVYVLWRATRTINQTSTFATVYSVILYASELFLTVQFLCSLVLMWQPIQRNECDINEILLNKRDWPTVDVFIVTYKEAEHIVEETIYGAMQLEWPADKLIIHVCDDGARDSMRALCQVLRAEFSERGSQVKLHYIARPKVAGTPNHAKAGNINHTLLKSRYSNAEFVLVLDCDMVVMPNFLCQTIVHFYEQIDGQWCMKSKASMIQVPQRFHNLGAKDPWWHTAEDFNAAGFEGSDGVGATPCVGTGVIFRRHCLAAIGGQSYDSVTEDFKTSFNLLANGYSTMYLCRNLVYGIAVDDVVGIYKQRLRWATGGLQILATDNPLFKPGLPLAATLLFFANAWQYVLSVPYFIFIIAPLVYLYTNVSPVYTLLIEAGVFLGGFIVVTRLLQWWQIRNVSVISKDLCLWRGSQQIVWLTPLFLEALLKFLSQKTLSRLQLLRQRSIRFVVSQKSDLSSSYLQIARSSWLVWMFYILTILGVIENFVLYGVKIWDRGVNFWLHLLLAVLLCTYLCAMMWPVVHCSIPTLAQEQQGLVMWLPAMERKDKIETIPEERSIQFNNWINIPEITTIDYSYNPSPASTSDRVNFNRYLSNPSERPSYVQPAVATTPISVHTVGDICDYTAANEAELPSYLYANDTHTSIISNSGDNVLDTKAVSITRVSDIAHDKLTRFSIISSVSRYNPGTSSRARAVQLMKPGLDSIPVVFLVPNIMRHYKFRLVYGALILAAGVLLPLVSIYVYNDYRFLVYHL